MKKKLLLFILLIIFSSLFTSCIRRTVKMTSYTHPNYFEKNYQKFCILVEGRTLAERKFYEEIIVENFRDYGIVATEGSILFPPIEEWTEDYYGKVLNKNGYDAFLLVTLSEEILRDELIPKVVTETQTNVNNDTTKKSTKTTTSVSTHKEMQRVLDIALQMHMKIIDVKNNQVSWQGESVKYKDDNNLYQLERQLSYMVDDLVIDLQNKKHLIIYD
ncbi:MAG: hypothetical protein R2863_10505 [Candidatus Kapaibacterium sp.]